MNFVQDAFKTINLQDDSLYDFLYDMVLFIGLKKSEEDIKNGRVMTLDELGEYINELEAEYEHNNIPRCFVASWDYLFIWGEFQQHIRLNLQNCCNIKKNI